jgi:hypothetical protein
LTDPDPDNLKSAAEYLLEIARNSEGRRYRKQPKIDALRQYKEEILEAHRWPKAAVIGKPITPPTQFIAGLPFYRL